MEGQKLCCLPNGVGEMGFKLSETFVQKSTGWGGKRPGAGRPKGYKPPPREKPPEEKINLKLNPIQKKLLVELGDGNLSLGIQRLIDQHL